MKLNKKKHVHVFLKGRSGSVTVCRCGAFRFTKEYLESSPPIVGRPK